MQWDSWVSEGVDSYELFCGQVCVIASLLVNKKEQIMVDFRLFLAILGESHV